MKASWFKQLETQALAASPHPDTRFPPSSYYRFLRILATNMQPKLSVVLGVSGGGCCFHLAMGYAPGKVIGVDIAWDMPDNINFIISDKPNFSFLRVDSIESAPIVYREHGKIDILFIDTIHTYKQTLKEFNAYKPYLSDKAVVCLDDLFRPGMSQAWRDLPGEKIRLDDLHIGAENGGGFGVIWNI